MAWNLHTRKAMFRLLHHLPIRCVLVPLAAALLLAARTEAAENPGKPPGSDICYKAVSAAEASFSLPFGILQAISMAELGRWDAENREIYAWPWTVTAHGKGKFYPTRAAAIAAVRRLKAHGVRNIDVGCMQINLYYHPKAFDLLEQAFDPAANTRYAARLFARLRKQDRSISLAVAHYHSSTRSRFLPYKRKVMRFWNIARQRYYAEQRRRRIEKWQAMHDAGLELRADAGGPPDS